MDIESERDPDPYRVQRQAFETQRQAFEHERERRDTNDRTLVAQLEVRVAELERHMRNVDALLVRMGSKLER